MLKLQGERISLRDFTPEDREPFRALEAAERMFTRMKFRVDRDSGERVGLPRLLEEPHLDPRTSYNLVVEDDEGFCGWAGVGEIQGADRGQIGWNLLSDRWGRGYATEPTRQLLDLGFSALDRATMWATADPDNRASLRVLQKCGRSRTDEPRGDLEGHPSPHSVHHRLRTVAHASRRRMTGRNPQ